MIITNISKRDTIPSFHFFFMILILFNVAFYRFLRLSLFSGYPADGSSPASAGKNVFCASSIAGAFAASGSKMLP